MSAQVSNRPRNRGNSNTYGNLSHKQLLDTVYDKYLAYARHSRLRRRRGAPA